MKINIFKTIIPAAAMVLTMSTTSCVGDLDVTPINPQQTMELDGDALFNKIYASFSLTGQTGPNGNGDIADVDEGRSDYFRTKWYLNEFTSDESHWVYATDAGIPELLHNSWGESCTFSAALYSRLYFTITLCNFYLEQNVQAADAEQRNAEVRFIRALNYYDVMDLYGGGAFTEKVSSEKAPYYNRQQMFDYVESELKYCAEKMAEPGKTTYGRADRVAAWNLLARLYLNAEVYTGTARWDDAMKYANNVINNGYYHLCEEGTVNPTTGEVYSPYQMLFLADNNKNGAQYENLVVGLFDGLKTKSYGGMTFLVQASYSNKVSTDDYATSGADNNWGKCIRLRKQLIDKFFTNTPAEAATLKDMTDAAHDDRALFFNKGIDVSVTGEGNDENLGYSCVKFRNVNSDGSSNADVKFVNTDLPVMRIAEAYLTYAEASIRKNGAAGNTDAADKINALRKRANATQKNTYTLDDVCDEWSREFWLEGRRRMDLIRFGKFAGQSKYKWEWMGGSYEGNQFPSYMNVFPLPVNELSNNPNLKQNPEY